MTTMINNIQIQRVTWETAAAPLQAIRQHVFIDEQKVPATDEWDDQDAGATHLLALREGQAVGVARVLASGKITRVAVLKAHRGLSIGKALLREAISVVRESGMGEAYLDAQCDAVDFYRQFGFQPEGATFIDAGIAHLRMRLSLR